MTDRNKLYVVSCNERPVRNLGKLKREQYDDTVWQGKLPMPGPGLRFAMLAWIARRHGNEAPAGGTPIGYAAPGRRLSPGAVVALVVVVLFATLVAAAMVRDAVSSEPAPSVRVPR